MIVSLNPIFKNIEENVEGETVIRPPNFDETVE
jgi:hypothetical protein